MRYFGYMLRYFNVYGPRMSDTGSYPPVFSVFFKTESGGTALAKKILGWETRVKLEEGIAEIKNHFA